MIKTIALFFIWFILICAPVYANETPWWQVQSVDTMKYSRDTSREALNNPSFDLKIEKQIKSIAEIGATHVAIATPYDEEFLPVLHRWVAVARAHGLKVWYRGNFSGWEGWFDYPKISRDTHISQTRNFIEKNPELFIDGDIFSACPECENGGPGDPRKTGDIEGHRLFLIQEHDVAKQAFTNINKNVDVSYNSMNGDVAMAIMNADTTKKLGGIVAVDHYVDTPEKLIADIKRLQKQSKGKIFLGEFGAPIPDINGNMTEKEQADWLDKALSQLVLQPDFIGLNYWVGFGGSTQIWNNDGSPRLAVNILKSYFEPKSISGFVKNEFGSAIRDAELSYEGRSVLSKQNGSFSIPILKTGNTLSVKADNYDSATIQVTDENQARDVVLTHSQGGVIEKILLFLRSLLGLGR